MFVFSTLAVVSHKQKALDGQPKHTHIFILDHSPSAFLGKAIPVCVWVCVCASAFGELLCSVIDLNVPVSLHLVNIVRT